MLKLSSQELKAMRQLSSQELKAMRQLSSIDDAFHLSRQSVYEVAVISLTQGGLRNLGSGMCMPKLCILKCVPATCQIRVIEGTKAYGVHSTLIRRGRLAYGVHPTLDKRGRCFDS